MTSVAKAFEQTEYRIDTGRRRHVLRVGQPYPPAFRQWLAARCRTRCAWILTACNPAAQRVDASVNDVRHAALATCLNAGAHRYAAAVNVSVEDDWPREPGFLLLDMDEGLACSLARRFGQLALVAVPLNGPAQLVWLDRE